MEIRLAASILFDAIYIEPALVTAFDLIDKVEELHKLYLVYLLGDNQEDAEAINILKGFCEKFAGEKQIVVITVENSLLSFSSYHFNNSIIYKALLPSIIPYEPFILNVDAGILLGGRFDYFWWKLNAYVNREKENWVIAAHCQSPIDWLPPTLIDQPHNRLYPAGGLMLFNSAQYAERRWYERLIMNYQRFLMDLRYAEQELVCLTAEEGELIALPEAEKRFIPHLGIDVLLGKAKRLPLECVSDSLFFKFTGSVKPWKYWVLDPDKYIFTKRRADLEAKFPLSGRSLIEHNRNSLSNVGWAQTFLEAYDVFLQKQGGCLVLDTGKPKLLLEKRQGGRMSKIDFIKENFAKSYKHEPSIATDNRLVHDVFGGCGIHTRSGIKTLIRMMKPRFILEIGSYHFETANQMAYAFDELYDGDHSIGHIHSFDIKKGGYDGVLFNPGSNRITSHTWIPHKTDFDSWKYTDPEITSNCDYANITNEEIFERNLVYLKNITPKGGFDMVYIDGDHSYKGAAYDLEYSLRVINPEALIIIDDIWDHRLHQVRDFYNDLKKDKWDFVEWNSANRDKVQNMGVFLP